MVRVDGRAEALGRAFQTLPSGCAAQADVLRLQQLEDDVLDVLAYIAGFGERRRIGHREGHVEDARDAGGAAWDSRSAHYS